MRAIDGRIFVRRVHDPPRADDGLRILVDRVWPRGISRKRARIDAWYRELAPSSGLRRWFGHAVERWPEFERRYFEELDGNGETFGELRQLVEQGRVTLLFAARDETRNNAVALRHYLGRHAKRGIPDPVRSQDR